MRDVKSSEPLVKIGPGGDFTRGCYPSIDWRFLGFSGLVVGATCVIGYVSPQGAVGVALGCIVMLFIVGKRS